jgi:internalin A
VVVLRKVLVVSGVVAITGIALALALAPHSLSNAVLLAVIACAPLVTILAVSLGSRRAGGAAIVAGLAVAGAGVATTVSTDALHLFRLDFPLTQMVINAATVLAPLGLVVVGIVLVVAGLAVLLGDRLLGAIAAMIMIGTAVAHALALLGLAVQPMAYRGGRMQYIPIAAAFVVAVAALLLVVVRRLSSAGTNGAGPDVPTAPSRGPFTKRRAARWTVVGATILLVAGTLGVAYQWLGSRLDPAKLFPDPALAACVRSAVGAADGERVPERELNSVFSLKCNGDLSLSGRIVNLDGLGHLPNLVSLDLSANAVADLSGLTQAPKLTNLKLTNNAVRDLRPLARLTALQELGLSGNAVTDLAPLADLTSLQVLGLSGNAVTDLGPLAGLTGLTELDVSGNRIDDVSALAGLSRLDRLMLARNLVADPSPLQALPALTTLDVSGNRISDAATVAGCPAVDELWVGGNPLTDLRPLLDMPALTSVDLSESDYPLLVGVEALRERGVYVGGLA